MSKKVNSKSSNSASYCIEMQIIYIKLYSVLIKVIHTSSFLFSDFNTFNFSGFQSLLIYSLVTYIGYKVQWHEKKCTSFIKE